MGHAADNPLMIRARTAGFLYLVVVMTGMFSLGYVPSRIAAGEGLSLIDAVRAAEPLFRAGIAASFICYVAFLLLPFALYPLLSPWGRDAAGIMVALVMVSISIAMLNLVHRLDILTLLDMPSLPSADRDVRAMLSLKAYGNGLSVAKIFWGLWLLPFGYLAFRSRAIPRPLAILLMAGCFGYLADVFGGLLLDGYAGSRLARWVTLPGSIGEIGSCLWLLVMGTGKGREEPHG